MTKTVSNKKVRAFGGVDCPQTKREQNIHHDGSWFCRNIRLEVLAERVLLQCTAQGIIRFA